ncbi:MAG TPA: 2-amino-4-hydroxy-6-hydroxymethyldihydropteridine diphosphokinase [Gemmatimonadaceae bacterium]|nr:2-amino-4-hydroxy-6-hydroxymethyldihydropteridine diphosphokinase [Gemmatimonadaceae bacterium]
MRNVAYIALGSNLGDRAAGLAQGRAALAALPRSRVLAATPVEETAPFGVPGQGAYLNQMVAIETGLSPRELLAELQRAEEAAGRTRDERWGPRTLDLDIVRFGADAIADADLTIPHPGLADRDFWQREAAWLDRELA